MDQQTSPIPAPLAYESRARDVTEAHPAAAMALCFPGLVCWCWFAALLLGQGVFFSALPSEALIPCWAFAILTAVFSLYRYRHHPRPWFVWVNLLINVSGLVFTAIVFVLIVFSR